MSALAAMQDALQDWLLEGDTAIAAFVDGEDASHRLRIYADAYQLRLIEILGNDFPATKAAFGDDAFDAFANGFLHAHPSTQPSVRHFGHAYPDWLSAQADAPPGLHELARFEWRQGECFDAADAATLDIDAVSALPVEAWPSLQLRTHPAVRLLSSHWLALRNDAPVLADDEAPADWLLWRNGFDVHWRCLDDDEADALHALQAGTSFGALCERMADFHGDDGALRAASLLKRWLTDGLLAAP